MRGGVTAARRTVSVPLGHEEIKMTLKSYRPWVKALQMRLGEEMSKAWAAA